jgi:AcrR family transcriptional regulator
VRTRPRQRLDGARRDDLLARVVDIFLSNGFSSVTVSALAQQLWCSKATLYSVAPTKEQLVILATKQFFGSSAKRIEARVAAERHPRTQIVTYLGGVADARR